MKKEAKIGLGGGCHWCTEAVFQSLRGVQSVAQGFIAADGTDSAFSEGVVVTYDPAVIPLVDLINIHLHTHQSTHDHALRTKYRSAIYVFNKQECKEVADILNTLQSGFEDPLITKVLLYKAFKPSDDLFQDYYYSNPDKPFCTRYISPKLKLLLDKFSEHLDRQKMIDY
ncbi:peptide-methionine (S)-S-oxide reductase [Spongiimicrobium sp. 3-5]|uniref:peptide-methionine (S)-S-oxide reductase n=1 Tax=Spongiimicrobium sp. 3-5 TaxID=3332596 RepID=UPI00397FE03A